MYKHLVKFSSNWLQFCGDGIGVPFVLQIGLETSAGNYITSAGCSLVFRLLSVERKAEEIIDRLLVRSSVFTVVELFYPLGNGSAFV